MFRCAACNGSWNWPWRRDSLLLAMMQLWVDAYGYAKEPTFKPTPPAFKLITRTLGFLDGDLNSVTAAFFFLMSIEPSKRYCSKCSRSSAVWMRSKKLVNCENTTARKQGSWSRSRSKINIKISPKAPRSIRHLRRSRTRASSLVEEWKSFRLRVTSGCESWELDNISVPFFRRTTSNRSLGCRIRTEKNKAVYKIMLFNLTLTGPWEQVGHLGCSPRSSHEERWASIQSLQLAGSVRELVLTKNIPLPLMHAFWDDHWYLHCI